MPTKPRQKKKLAPKVSKAEPKKVKAPVAKRAAKPASSNVQAFYAAVGRRKTAVARVRLSKGHGAITVNGKTLEKYFPDLVWQEAVMSPLVTAGQKKTFDISILTAGGGVNAQSEAARHGIARALEKFDATLRPTLKKAGMLTRDPREKERKKYGLKRARRAPQFSKR